MNEATQRRFFVADIGGTNARFAVAQGNERDGYTVDQVKRYHNEDFAQLHDAAEAYFSEIEGPKPARGCMAIAGPINGHDIRLTNSTWRLKPKHLAERLGMDKLCAVNDFAAQARGAPICPPDQRVSVRKGIAKPHSPMIVLGPGTGLGLGILVPVNGKLHVIPTEGGHAAFSPGTDEEAKVWQFLHREHGFVSWELLLSGRGLVNIRRALAAEAGEKWFPVKPSEITDGAVKDPESLCGRTVALFCSALGVYAGNAALMTGAQGGIYLGGGILPKIRDLFEKSDFRLRFAQRGPMSQYVENIPVWLLLADTTPLLGAAALAESELNR